MPVFLFCDIEDAAQKWELNPEVMAKALTAHDEIFLKTIKTFGGKAILHAGDGIFALFQDRNALDCALALQEKVAQADWGPVGGVKVRMALHAGDAEKEEDPQFAIVTDRTASILATAWGGQIVLTPAALDRSNIPNGGKTTQLGTHFLKDLLEPQTLLGFFHASLSRQDFPPLRSLSTRPNNLPAQRTHFFGRDLEMKKIKYLLKDPSCRLLTLLGQGGIGKTRLVTQAAAEQIDDFTDGVYFVSLAPVNSPDGVLSAIASAVRFTFSGESDTTKELLGFFKDRKILLVLDNFEHLLPAAAFVNELLVSAPGVKVLISSRVGLHLANERIMEVEGMEYPEEGSARSAESFSAFKFFINCVRRVRGDFFLKEEEIKEAARICQLVNGAPLGLELAAVWVQILSCREVRVEIEKNIDFLASNRQDVPERQRSLRAIFEYSWNLLNHDEKRAVRATSVFRGGFTAKQAESIVNCPPNFLSTLVEKSLLHQARSGRFEVHELLRQFFTAKLKELPEEDEAVHTRHMTFFLNFLTERHQKLRGYDEAEALHEIDQEHNNIQSAWEWAVETGKISTISTSSDSLYHYYEINFLAQVGEKNFHLAQTALSMFENDTNMEKVLALARVTARMGWFSYQKGKMEVAEALMKKGLTLARKTNEKSDIGQCLHFLCALYRATSRFDLNEECAEESMKIFEELKDDWGIAWSFYHLVPKARHEGRYDEALNYCAKSLEMFRKMEYADGEAWTLFGLGQISVLQKNFNEAKRFFEQSIKIFKRHENNVAAGWVLIDQVRMHTALEENETSFVMAKKAYEAFKLPNHSLGMGWSQYYRSESAYHVREYEEALRAGQEAITFLDEAGGQSGQAWVCVNLCRTANALGRYKEGHDYGKRGIELFLLSVGDGEGANGCRIHLAQSETGLKKFQAAEKLLMQALDSIVELKIYWRILEGLLILAKLRAAEDKVADAFHLSCIVQQHSESQKGAKVEAASLRDEYSQRLSLAEVEKLATSTESVELVPFIKQLVADHQSNTTQND